MRRWYWLVLGAPLVAGVGFFTLRAQASSGGFGFGHPCFGGGPKTPEEHKAFMTRRLDKIMTGLKADDYQRSAIKAIAERTFDELSPLHEQHGKLHDQLTAAITAETVDANAIETLRSQVADMADQAARVASKALFDAARGLSPEQRRNLVKQLEEHHGRHRR